MGTGNSKSSFKPNNSLANSINFLNSQQFSFADNSNKSINKQPDVLTKFSWIHGGNQVFLIGSFNRWKQTLPLNKHMDQFSITILLPRGLHYYKFVVDGEWRFSPQDPSIPDNSGNINNYIDTTNYHALIQKQKSSSGQVATHKYIEKPNNQKSIQQFNKQAPKLSPHYNQCTYLNLQSNLFIAQTYLQQHLKSHKMDIQHESYIEFEKNLTPQEVRFLFNSYHCLQPPTHATLDHLITQKNNNSNYTSMSITQRFKSKCTTYKYFTVINKFK